MIQDTLRELTEYLESETSTDNATFGIFHYGGGADESFIQANPEGLKLFALQLLKAANQTSGVFPIPSQEKWIDDQSDTIILYVEPIEHRPTRQHVDNTKSTTDKLLPYIVVSILVILLVSMLVGLWTLLKWIF